MEEIKIGFLRGIGFYLSTVFIGLIIGIIVFLTFYIYRIFTRECIYTDYVNGKHVCLEYKYK